MEKYIAVKRLRWGTGWIEPGEEVPADQRRNYIGMLRLGQISRVGDLPTRANRARAARRTGGSAGSATTPAGERGLDDLTTVAELRAFAEEHQVELHGATKRDDIRQRIADEMAARAKVADESSDDADGADADESDDDGDNADADQ